VLVYFVLRAGHRVTLADGLQSPSENLIHAVDFINRSLLYAFLIAGVISAVTLIVKIAQLARSSRRAAPSAGAWSAGKERT
jgi:hypothetical protein